MILPCEIESVDVVENYAKSFPVVIPTDTLYGLAMSVYGPIERIYELKRRDFSKRIPIGVHDLKSLREIAFTDSSVERLVKRFMPGALTIILRSRIPEITGDTVGVRIPNHPIPIELARRIGPITLTSANLSGGENPVSIDKTMKIPARYRIDCGPLPGIPSTVISMVDEIKLIRAGAISFSEILEVLRR